VRAKLLDDLGRRLHIIGNATHAEAREAAEPDGRFRELDYDGDSVYDGCTAN
jgi:hypothetical protein